jgi:hypothetical protein
MKYILIFIVFISMSCTISSEENNIWGCWNTEEKNEATSKLWSSMGMYKRTSYFLLFDPDYHGVPLIIYDARLFIKEIIPSNDKNVVYLILEEKQYNYDINGDRIGEPMIIKGKVVMHFIDKDHMWLEVDRNDEKYKTDEKFSDGYFKGPSVIFWRAEKLKE